MARIEKKIPLILLAEQLFRPRRPFHAGRFREKGKMLLWIVMLSCLDLSVAYELGEFALVKLLDVPINAVMGTQGDSFDSHRICCGH